MKKITVPADLEQLTVVTEFIDAELEAQECSMKVQMQIDLAVEEIFMNIANYAYHPVEGDATISL